MTPPYRHQEKTASEKKRDRFFVVRAMKKTVISVKTFFMLFLQTAKGVLLIFFTALAIIRNQTKSIGNSWI